MTKEERRDTAYGFISDKVHSVSRAAKEVGNSVSNTAKSAVNSIKSKASNIYNSDTSFKARLAVKDLQKKRKIGTSLNVLKNRSRSLGNPYGEVK